MSNTQATQSAPGTAASTARAGVACAAVDTNRDGRPNFFYVGIDRNRDGIPDALQAASDLAAAPPLDPRDVQAMTLYAAQLTAGGLVRSPMPVVEALAPPMPVIEAVPASG